MSAGRPPGADDYAKALMNILEDARSEKEQLEATQRAVLNIVEDFAVEKDGLQQVQKAMFNIFDDLQAEKSLLERAQHELVRSGQEIQSSLEEKEVLLKEVHHRVKNNLAVISSLLYLESTYTRDEQLVRVLQESQRRVRSMALVHEALYGSKNLSEIDFGEYGRVLASELAAGCTPRQAPVRVHTELRTLAMKIDLAVPCGLILSELLSNAFKHAFPDDRGGDITVTVRPGANGMGLLHVADNGVGLPKEFDMNTNRSLGVRLIRSLVRQIRGSFEFVPLDPGTEARLTFATDQHAQAS